MRLERLTIYTSYKSDNYKGTAEFEGSYGKVELHLEQRLSEKILAVCADEIVASSKEVAEAMTATFIESQLAPAIEHQDGAD